MQRTMFNTNTRYSWNRDILKKSDTWMGDSTNKYTAVFRAYGNIDRGENPDMEICPPLEIWADDIDTIVKALKGYIIRNNLGVGNLSSVEVKKNDKPVARVFYNSRVEYIGDK